MTEKNSLSDVRREKGLPEHPFSRKCHCLTCQSVRGGSIVGNASLFPSEEGGSTPTPPLHPEGRLWKPKELRFARVSEQEARSYLIPRHYLPRWYVGTVFAFGALVPDNILVGCATLSTPAARSARFTAKNTLEIRRFYMEDVCGRNSESRFLAWILRTVQKLCPRLHYVITFEDPRYGAVGSAFRAVGFQEYLSRIASNWSSHKKHRSIEAPTNKRRMVYSIWKG